MRLIDFVLFPYWLLKHIIELLIVAFLMGGAVLFPHVAFLYFGSQKDERNMDAAGGWSILYAVLGGFAAICIPSLRFWYMLWISSFLLGIGFLGTVCMLEEYVKYRNEFNKQMELKIKDRYESNS